MGKGLFIIIFLIVAASVLVDLEQNDDQRNDEGKIHVGINRHSKSVFIQHNALQIVLFVHLSDDGGAVRQGNGARSL